MMLAQFGAQSQYRLKAARILLIGIGGLGAPCALYLAGAGVGTLGLVDADVVSLSNLHRQILYQTADCGLEKCAVAAKQLHALNPEVKIETHGLRLDSRNANEIIAQYDLVVDGTDSLESRYVISQACVELSKPHVFAGIFQHEGHLAVFDPSSSGCYRCLYPQPPLESEIPNCSVAGVLGPLAGVMGSLQALEAIKCVAVIDGAVRGKLFVINTLTLESQLLTLPRRPDCPHCGSTGTRKKQNYDSTTFIERFSEHKVKFGQSEAMEAVWLDVRTADEYELAHHAGALHLPLTELNEAAKQLDRDRTYVVYCATGRRSHQARQLLNALGLTHVMEGEPFLS
jgi:molybdopterin/thiamine biosynthesis adenylyltransferase/rhodanese-related sulfurtransferase